MLMAHETLPINLRLLSSNQVCVQMFEHISSPVPITSGLTGELKNSSTLARKACRLRMALSYHLRTLSLLQLFAVTFCLVQGLLSLN